MRPRHLSILVLALFPATLTAQTKRMATEIAAEALVDQGAPGRLKASSVPTYGQLFPLGDELFVAPNGRVGIHTTQPVAHLQAEGSVVLGVGQYTANLNATGFIAGGTANQASGAYATAIGGVGSKATGLGSAVIGSQSSTASGSFGFVAGGVGCEAAGNYSWAGGRYAKALHDYSFIWNSSSTLPFQTTGDYQFIVRAPGGFGVGTNAPDCRFHVTEGTDTTPTGGGYIQTGESFGANLSFDENEIMARNNGVVSSLFLNHQGGDVLIGAAGGSRLGIGTTNPAERLHVVGNVRCTNLIETSDARLKQEVEDLEQALEAVLALRGVSFSWRDAELDAQDPGRHIGFLAQEVREVLPDAIREAQDGTLGVDYTAIVPVLVEALQSQEERLRALEARVLGER